jgi:hypothetical protein
MPASFSRLSPSWTWARPRSPVCDNTPALNTHRPVNCLLVIVAHCGCNTFPRPGIDFAILCLLGLVSSTSTYQGRRLASKSIVTTLLGAVYQILVICCSAVRRPLVGMTPAKVFTLLSRGQAHVSCSALFRFAVSKSASQTLQCRLRGSSTRTACTG